MAYQRAGTLQPSLAQQLARRTASLTPDHPQQLTASETNRMCQIFHRHASVKVCLQQPQHPLQARGVVVAAITDQRRTGSGGGIIIQQHLACYLAGNIGPEIAPTPLMKINPAEAAAMSELSR